MPGYIWVLAISAAIAIPGLTAVLLGHGARTVGGGAVGLVAVAAVSAVLVISTVLAATGVYQRGTEGTAPWFGLFFAAVLAAALLASRLPAVRGALRAPGMTAWLVLPHVFRIEGIVFVILVVQGQLPAEFGLPAGIGDVVAGLSAPFVARRLARGTRTRAGVWFAVFGLADLVAALGLGFLSGLGPVRVFGEAVTTVPLSQLPLALIPTVAVPTAIALHVVSLTMLRRREVATAGPADLVPAPVA